MEVRNKILALRTASLYAHQIAAIAGHDSNNDTVNSKLLLPENTVKLFNAVPLVQQIVNQNDRPVERPERADLARQRRIIRIFLNRKTAHIGCVAFFYMERLCNRIGHDGIREDFSVGHAHIWPQLPDAFGHILHAVHTLNTLGDSLIEQFRVKAQKKLARKHGTQRHTQAGPGL